MLEELTKENQNIWIDVRDEGQKLQPQLSNQPLQFFREQANKHVRQLRQKFIEV